MPQTSRVAPGNPETYCKGSSAFARLTRISCLLLVLAAAPVYLFAKAQQPAGAGNASAIAVQKNAPVVQLGTAENTDELKPLEDGIAADHYQSVVPGLKLYLQNNPSSARAHYDLGYVFFRTHQIDGAVRELSKSLQLNVNNPQAHKILGLVCTFVGRYDLAEVELRYAAHLEPSSAEIHYFLGRVYYARDVFPLALKQFETAIKLDPSYMKAYNNLGLVMEVFGKNPEAVDDYNTAARLDEAQHLNSPWPYEYLSAYYNRNRRPDQAIQFAQKAIQVNPRCDVAYFELAKAYQTQNEWNRAAEEARKAIAINSSTPEYFYLLSIALRRLGKTQESDEALKKFEQIHKNKNAAAILWRKANKESKIPKTQTVPANEPY
jgi:tetratricopeptide (TPR) repeat protein